MILVIPTLCWAQQDKWSFIEETYLNGEINQVVRKGCLLKVGQSAFYIIDENVQMNVQTQQPRVRVYQAPVGYLLDIDDFDGPVLCSKLSEVIETSIAGDFHGWTPSAIFRMANGQIWKQTSSEQSAWMEQYPSVAIYKHKGRWFLKVKNIEGFVEVMRIQ